LSNADKKQLALFWLRSWLTDTGLIFIYLHLNSHHHLCYTFILSSHAINSILDTSHAKNQPSHRFVTFNLMAKQQAKLRSPIKDVNECLNEIDLCFNPIHTLFSPSSGVVDHFSSKITSCSSLFSSNKDIHIHIQNLNHTFR